MIARPRAVWIAALLVAALYATRLVGIWHYATQRHASTDESVNAPAPITP